MMNELNSDFTNNQDGDVNQRLALVAAWLAIAVALAVVPVALYFLVHLSTVIGAVVTKVHPLAGLIVKWGMASYVLYVAIVACNRLVSRIPDILRHAQNHAASASAS